MKETNRTETDDIQSLLAVVNRLDAKRFALPARLPRQHDRDRDREEHAPLPKPERGHKHRSQPLPNVWDWRSKQM
jgi:hypothetical protein